MQAEAETIRKMSETLESVSFTRDQSDAFIQSMALAMKTFAVTPEILDSRLAEHRKDSNRRFDTLDQRLEEHKRDSNQRLDEIPKLRDAVHELKNSMHELQRSVMNYFLGFTLVIFAGLMGILAAVLAS